jgi:hypothetical protein
LGPALATAWLVGITAAQFMGLMATHYIPRYALVLLAPTPLFLLMGVHFKRSKSYWWILIATLLATLYSTRFPGRSVIHSSPEVKESALNPHPDFWAVRDGLGADDAVIDLTGNRLLPDLWSTRQTQIFAIRDEDTSVDLAGRKEGRRVLIFPGALNMGDPVRQWVGANEGRLKEIRPYVFEDTQPKETLKLRLIRLEN